MHILITGAFGFIGSYISKSELLKKKHRLLALDIYEPKEHHYEEYYSWDDLEQIDWSSIDAIIHLAGKAHDTKNTSKYQDYHDINVGLTKTIFDYFLKSKSRKFIYFSSVKAIADTVPGSFLTEDETPHPQSPYGKSKLEAEEYLLGHEPGGDKKVYILRPCMIHGPGNKGNLNLLYQFVQKGLPWPLGDFENKRSFTSIDNLLYVLEQLINNEIEPGIYHVADDDAIATNDIIRLMGRTLNRRSIIWKISPKFVRSLAKIGDYLPIPMNSERLKKLTENYLVSNNKLKKAMGIKKLPTNAIEGMQKTLSSFRIKPDIR